ncbi:MAG TPA: ubiquinone/menaquinone biosynthesis methyltransferase [Candidatus Binataceae bacterium]|jgi:demethylmenaquinone methyltransferase/2-methoxy-6-polyprenyl-1,4-benzoquinol methylase|nr:ubiquinone/menaquinone biosynthesis methyltransferase [Candidatus Binataceae bacterium]
MTDAAAPPDAAAPAAPTKPARIRAMFTAIVPRYDLVNRLMTLGLDQRWRRQTVAAVAPRDGVVLDIAAGTGDLAFEAAKQGARRVLGADFCPRMIEAARRKARRLPQTATVRFLVADAMSLPFADASFDAIVNGFMLRNVADLSATFVELARVLKPGGRLACLDLTPPRGLMRHFFSLYIATVVPLLGVIFARNYAAYRYLFDSLAVHPDADRVAAMMRAAGFRQATYRVTGFGTVAIHLGVK